MGAENLFQVRMRDFGAGWCPSDDAFNGRKNALLKMDGVTLDSNGALIINSGSKTEQGPYPTNAHTFFQKIMCGERRNYLGLTNGAVYRNATEIIPAGDGSTTRAAFGVYGDYVLVMSGDQRIKDSCDGIVSFGLAAPDADLIINLFSNVPVEGTDFIGTLSNYVAGTGSVAVVDDKLRVTVSNDVIVNKTAYITNTSVVDFPKDLSGADEDIFQFSLSTEDFSRILAVNLIFFLKTEDSLITDYFSYQFIKDVDFSSIIFDANGVATFKIRRSQFVRSGSDNSLTWANIIGVGIGISGASSAGGSYYSTDVVADLFGFKLYQVGEDGNLNGDYQWGQVNVFRSGNHVSLSSMGPISDTFHVENGYAEVIPQDPTLIEPNANEVWIYRRGGKLQQFYRVGVILYDELGPLYDNMSDDDALALGIVFNSNVVTIDETLPPEAILEIVGPIFGRMLYFSATSIYPSEVNNPDAYDPRNVMLLVSDEAEKFQWARKVAENTIMIGTTRDVYILVGTFTQFPDGALDVYIRNLSVNKPPISRFAGVYNNTIIYFGSQEWVALAPTGQYTSLVSPNTDRLYTGQKRYDYGGVPSFYDDVRVSYAVAVAKNKLWCVVPSITDYTDPNDITTWVYRLEVFDFGRKYWRTVTACPFLILAGDDDALFGFFTETKSVSLMDYPFSKLLNATITEEGA